MVPMKLGEMLVKEGKITPAELEETLRGQAIFGGRFGTNLVEMGILTEDELAYFLSQKTGVPQASAEQLMNVPSQVVSLISEETARKYRVVPMALNNRKLSLAMTDPADFAALDEISFATGYIVLPLITPELRLICALEKYYNVKRELRYIPVAGGSRSRGRSSQGAQTAAPSQPAAASSLAQQAAPAQAPVLQPEEEFLELLPLEELDLADLGELQMQNLAPATGPASAFPGHGASTAAAAAPAPASPILHPAAPQAPVAAVHPSAHPAFQPAVQHPTAAASVTAAALDLEPERDFSLEGVLRGLTQAEDRHDIAELLVGYAARQFKRSAIFMVKGAQATGWLAQIGTEQIPGFDAVELSLQEPSVVRIVAEAKTPHLGPIPISPGNSRIMAALGGTPSVNQLYAPLLVGGRVVAVLYVDGGSQPLDEQLPELQKLLGKASLAFEILILKNKILMT